MNRENIEARKLQLQDTLQKMKAAAAQHQANLHGIEGAIADCDFWLSQLPPSQEATQEPTAAVETASSTAVASVEEPVAGGESTVPSKQAA